MNTVWRINLKTNCDAFDCTLNDLYLLKRGIIMKEQILHQKYLMLMSERSILINADTFLNHCRIDFSSWFHLSTITYFSSNFHWAAWPKIIESPFLMLHYWNGLLTSFSRVANEVKCEFRSTKKTSLCNYVKLFICLPADWHCLHFIYSFFHLYSWIVAF